jgi:hypothetical protein
VRVAQALASKSVEARMSDILIRIKRAILAGNYEFTDKALCELETDGLEQSDALESILNAVAILKTIRSTSALRTHAREYLHVIISANLQGRPIYTKGKLVAEMGVETYYFLISSKYAE